MNTWNKINKPQPTCKQYISVNGLWYNGKTVNHWKQIINVNPQCAKENPHLSARECFGHTFLINLMLFNLTIIRINGGKTEVQKIYPINQYIHWFSTLALISYGAVEGPIMPYSLLTLLLPIWKHHGKTHFKIPIF